MGEQGVSITPSVLHPAGLRQSLATAGMLLGSSIAAAAFAATQQNYILTFTLATIPTGVALLWLIANFKVSMRDGG